LSNAPRRSAEAPDVCLLDNMTNGSAARGRGDQQAPSNGGPIILEASGNVNLDTIKAIAETGVDYISTSKITMAAPTLDIGLDMAIV
jgi:nicotinate-nucleotide pyrophosphorylase (carboxylating)